MCGGDAAERREIHGCLPQMGCSGDGHRRVTEAIGSRSPGTVRVVVDVPPRTVAHEGPIYNRPLARPDWQDDLVADTSAKLPGPSSGDELKATCLRCWAVRTCAAGHSSPSKVRPLRRGNTVPRRACRVVCCESTGYRSRRRHRYRLTRQGRYTQLDPYTGAQLALGRRTAMSRVHRRNAHRGPTA